MTGGRPHHFSRAHLRVKPLGSRGSIAESDFQLLKQQSFGGGTNGQNHSVFRCAPRVCSLGGGGRGCVILSVVMTSTRDL